MSDQLGVYLTTLRGANINSTTKVKPKVPSLAEGMPV
jgi:hypothetical protein